MNFPVLYSNVSSAPAYGVYVSQLIRYARACSSYQDFVEREKVFITRLLSRGKKKKKKKKKKKTLGTMPTTTICNVCLFPRAIFFTFIQ